MLFPYLEENLKWFPSVLEGLRYQRQMYMTGKHCKVLLPPRKKLDAFEV